MNRQDNLLQLAANHAIPQEIKVIWEPMIWGVKHMDLIPRIMGRVPCDQGEREKLKIFLLDEKRYELYVAMLYCDSAERNRAGRAASEEKNFPSAFEDDTVFYRMAYGQLHAFLRWCDADDESALVEKGSAMDLYRLCYIAIAVGYGKMAFALISNMDDQTLQDAGAAFARYGGHQRALLKKWIRDFVHKQPKGRYKKQLMRRMSRYGMPLIEKRKDEI